VRRRGRGSEEGDATQVASGWEGKGGVKKYDKWVPQAFVGMKYGVQGMTGAEKLKLYCKFSLTRQNILLGGGF
jgi:hypothetical protein